MIEHIFHSIEILTIVPLHTRYQKLRKCTLTFSHNHHWNSHDTHSRWISNTLLWRSPTHGLGQTYSLQLTEFMPITRSRNLMNDLPCRGFVIKSAIMSPVLHHTGLTSPRSILSLTKKYRTSICLVRFELDNLPFFSNKIALLLSWYRMLSLTV